MKKQTYELTNPQKSIWMTEQFYEETNINNIVGYLKIKKNVDLTALEKAFNYFVMKNDSFKIKIIMENNVAKQYFDDFIYENIEIIDLKDETQLSEFESSFPMQTINVKNNYLFLTKLLRFPDTSGILVLTAHHLIADAWTMSLVLEEIHNNYIALINNQQIDLSPNPSYIEFINSQEEYIHSSKFEKDKDYWKEQFNNLPNIVSFKGNSQTSINSNRKMFPLSPSYIKKIQEFCTQNKISDYIFLLSVYSFYFSNLFNNNKFIIGNPVLNRSNFREKQMTGMFVSVMPFVVNIEKNNNSFINLCHKIATDQKTMYRHIKYSYYEILEFVRKKHKFSDSLYDIVFSYQNATTPSYCKWLPNHSQTESLQIHIKNVAEEKNNLTIHYDYLTDIFSENDIDLMHIRILKIIKQILDNNFISLNDLEIISDEEKNVLDSFNNTKKTYNNTSNIVKEFEKIVKKYPKSIAIIDKETSYTYEELNCKANFLANKILELDIQSDIISFSLNRSAAIVITILAILKSGHTYMPIDPEYPIDRINFMLKNSNTKVLITNKNFMKKINYIENCILYEDLEFDKILENPNIKISPTKLCYIMYTSGSTGIPKAVSIMHYNVINFVQSMQQRLDYNFSPKNKVISVTTVCFDIFVFELYPTLLSGLTLVIADKLESRSPKLLSELIKEHKITKILTTPSRIELLFSNRAYIDNISSIREFILGGEVLSTILLKTLQTYTKANIYNLYGPTETTVYSCFKDVTNSENITIGKPINNTHIYILNDNNILQPIGRIGEICIGGEGVGAGYYNNEDKTKSVFIKNPFSNDILYKTGDLGYWLPNGELICMGRKDNQVKIRGYRVELDDISNNILNFNNVDQCVVIYTTDSNNKKCLCAYLVGKRKINIRELKKYLVNILPHYMIPNYFMQLSKLPLTVNYKIDRKALPKPNKDNLDVLTKYKKPTNKIEKDLCNIFEETISINNIGIDDDIFDYPIDSLDIIKIQTKMLEFNYKLNTQDFYKSRTISTLSKEIINKENMNINKKESEYLTNINNSFNKYPSVMQFETKNYKNILLLGSTGYLGIHILHELLELTDSNIICILRKKEYIDASNRISELYKFYFNKKLPLKRLKIIDSDITEQKLGLDKDTYQNLTNTIDLVINSAANVRYYGDYEKFKRINVDVVKNLINLCKKNTAQLVHISTLGVSGNYLVNHQKNYNKFSENDFYIRQQFKENVYIQTKFEAEKLIYENINSGLNASIFRVGNLTSRYSDGQFQQNFEENAFYNILIMILKYHILPNTMENEFLEFTPIDYCAKSIIKLIFNLQINKYVFHLYNENYIKVSELLKIFKKLGFHIELQTGIDFKNNILKLSNKYKNENILKGIVNDLDDNLGLSFSSTVIQNNSNTNYCLEKLDFDWPLVTEDYIIKIINYLKRKKFI